MFSGKASQDMAAGVQKHGSKGQKGFNWSDLGAAMDAKDVQQGIEPSPKNETQTRNATVTGNALFKLAKANGFRCALSGVEMEPDHASIDHVVPLSKGGEHSMSNMAIIHITVNRMKGEMDHDEFVRWCTLIARWNG